MDEMPRNFRTARSLRVLLAPADRALAVLLGMEPDIDVVAQVRAGDDLAAAAIMCRPEVALVDEVSAVSAVLAEVPECRVLVLATSAHPGLAGRALAAGAAGLVLRDGPVPDLAEAIRRASTGETVVDPALGDPAGA
ncbi:DNA-binding response regulator [Streptomyces sp. NPDC101118]|uniref:DNA-binding response regulator n=1 Tax=Streptomyces sp. NPDC101118 TaxID=3366109 RepID=UPI00381A6B40